MGKVLSDDAEVLGHCCWQTSALESFEDCSVLCCRLNTECFAGMPGTDVFGLFNQLVTIFSDLAIHHGCELVDFGVGFVYAVCGHSEDIQQHAVSIVRLALAMLNAARVSAHGVELCFGLHTGRAYAGLLGKRWSSYKFFGDAMDVARGLVLKQAPMNIRVS